MRLLASLIGMLAMALPSCVAERERPDAGGVPCESHEDCDEGLDAGTCGSLRLCVAGFCEVMHDADAAGSRVVPCP